jgi:cellulose synthase/poly-beta-1,6-N-acetylglucosamine synthase-like glycosyltransferase
VETTSPETLLPTLALPAYLAALGLLAMYGLHRVSHLRRFRWGGGREGAGGGEGESARRGPTAGDRSELPVVTVQLPLFNERTVAARLIRAAGELDWPADRLEIQVLDDSTDDTRAIVDAETAALRERGIDAVVLRRRERSGYKAGALEHGLACARGDLLCVFDADFVPGPDVLRRLVPAFADPGVGMVQARWGHLNRDESALTRAQSTLLDGHFVIEHKVRSDAGWFFNFNGTAGMWRRAAIEDAGGWEHDTLTEDLDLSYRAQLAGWRFVYLPDVVAPAEVPPGIAAFKSQQHRWAKGSVQVARKLMVRILRADLPLRVKLEAVAHLTGNTGYPLVLGLAVLLPLAVAAQDGMPAWYHLALFFLCTFSVVLFYDTSQRAIGRSGRARLRDVPAAMSLGIGMCVSQTRAVLEGLRRDPGTFVRTPKRGESGGAPQYSARLRGLPGLEVLLALWFAWGIAAALSLGLWGALPFLLLFFSGFAWVGVLSIADWRRQRASAARA